LILTDVAFILKYSPPVRETALQFPVESYTTELKNLSRVVSLKSSEQQIIRPSLSQKRSESGIEFVVDYVYT